MTMLREDQAGPTHCANASTKLQQVLRSPEAQMSMSMTNAIPDAKQRGTEPSIVLEPAQAIISHHPALNMHRRHREARGTL